MEKKVESLIRRSPRANLQFSGFRRYARKKISLNVMVCDEDGLEVPLESVDLSETGVFLKSSILFDIGQRHVLEFEDQKGRILRLHAEVVRVAGDSSSLRRAPKNSVAGMGYEFLETDRQIQDRLQSLMNL